VFEEGEKMSGSQSQPLDVNMLLQGAAQEGELSAQSLQALNGIPDIGARIMEGMGASIDGITSAEVFLLAMLIDDSGSIRMKGNAQPVRDGHNKVIDELLQAKKRDNVLVSCRYLNGEVLYPFLPLDQAIKMDAHNFNPEGGTPLYDESMIILATQMAKAKELRDAGIAVTALTLIVTDGNDQHSIHSRPVEVARQVQDMLSTEYHIVSAMGIDDGTTDFRAVFASMGIPDNWIYTVDSTGQDIRHGFNLFSQSARKASQGAQSFSETALGGFGK
jgi:hypothetical protein